jgi:surfactin synthase thioesterase subunit
MAYAEVDLNAWIRRYHPSGDHAGQLVCFPRAGGSASYYRPLSTRSQSSCWGLATSRRCSSGTAWAPSSPSRSPGGWKEEAARRLSASSPPAGGPTGIARYEKVHQRDDAGLIAEIRHLDGTESALLENDEILRMSLPLSALSSGEV